MVAEKVARVGRCYWRAFPIGGSCTCSQENLLHNSQATLRGKRVVV
jgi:hypothetical protein